MAAYRNSGEFRHGQERLAHPFGAFIQPAIFVFRKGRTLSANARRLAISILIFCLPIRDFDNSNLLDSAS
jgi:hypothetical protein